MVAAARVNSWSRPVAIKLRRHDFATAVRTGYEILQLFLHATESKHSVMGMQKAFVTTRNYALLIPPLGNRILHGYIYKLGSFYCENDSTHAHYVGNNERSQWISDSHASDTIY